MSDTVDDRIVQMSFDNKQFESGIKTSLGSLDNLKKGLNFNKSGKSLLNLGSVFKRLSGGPVNGLVDGVSTIANRFTLLGVTGMAVIQRLTNAAIDMAKRMLGAVTGIEAVMSGFSEYETQINAIQTILANTSSKGTTLTEVTKALDELNTYADRTIYNFTEMTRNIGTFTAAGTDLDVSVAAIKGIANLAAVSGSNSLQASTAMYQLSQAISSGTVRLQDWNSVQNAGMGGAIFQDELQRTAKQHGITIDAIMEKEGSFRDSLQTGWLSSEILLDTLAKFTGDMDKAQLEALGYTQKDIEEIMKLGTMANDAATKVKTMTQLIDTLKEAAQSGWTKSWELVVGDFEQAKEVFTGASDALGALIGKSAEQRNEILGTWNRLHGRDILIQAITNAFEALLAVMKPIQEAFKEIFPPMTGHKLFALTVNLREFTEKLTLTEPQLENVKKLFKGLFSVIIIAKDLFVAIGDAVKRFLVPLLPTSDAIFEFAGRIGDFLVGLKDSIKSGNLFSFAIESMVAWIREAIAKFGVVIGNIKEFSSQAVSTILLIYAKVKPSLDKLKAILLTIAGFFVFLYRKIVTLVPELKKSFSTLSRTVQDFFTKMFTKSLPSGNKVNVLDNVLDSLTGFTDRIKKAFSGFTKIDTSGFKTFIENMKARLNVFDLLKRIGGTLGSVFSRFSDILSNLISRILPDFGSSSEKAGENFIFDFLAKIAEMVGPLLTDLVQGIFDGLGNIKFDTILDLLNAGLLGTLILSISGFMKSLTAMSKNANSVVTTIKGTFTNFSNMFTGVSGILDQVRDSVAMWQKDIKAKILLKIAGALGILTLSILILSLIDSEKLLTATLAITAMFAELALSMKIFDKGLSGQTGFAQAALGMVGMSVAILILSSALLALSVLSWEEIERGLAAITGIIAITLSAGAVLSKTSGSVIQGALALVIFSGALLVMAGAVKLFSLMDPNALTRGLLGVGTVLAELALFIKLLGSQNNSIQVALSMVIMAGALLLLSMAVQKFGAVDPDELKQGLVGIGVIFAEIALFVKLLGDGATALKAAASLGVISASLSMLAKAIKEIGGMSVVEVVVGLLAIAAGLGVMVLALNSLGDPKTAMLKALALIVVSASLLVLAEAIKSMSELSWEEAGRGLTVLAASLAILAIVLSAMTGTVAGSAALLVAAGALLLLAPAIAALGALSLAQIGMALLAIAGMLTVLGLAAYILAPVIPVLLALSAAILLFGLATLAVGAGVMLFATGLAALAVAGVAGVGVLIFLIRSVVELLPFIAEQIGLAILAFINVIKEGAPAIVEALVVTLLALIEGLAVVIPPLVELITNLILLLVETIMELAPVLIQAGWDLLLMLLQGIADNIADVVTTVSTIITEFLGALEEELPLIVEAGFDLIIAFIDGLTASIEENLPTLIESAKGLATAIVNGIIEGLGGESIEQVVAAVGGLGEAALAGLKDILGIQSPSKEFEDIGVNSGAGFAEGFVGESGSITDSVTSLAAELLAALDNDNETYFEAGRMIAIKIGEGILLAGAETTAPSMQGFILNLLAGISMNYPMFAIAGKEIVHHISVGMRHNFLEGLTVVIDFITLIREAFGEAYLRFVKVGEDIVKGVALGITYNTGVATTAVQQLAQAMVDMINSILGIGSPSRVFMEIGRFADEGLAKGINRYSNKVTDSVKDLANNSIKGFTGIISKISNAIDSEMDTSPTIRPVVDLSDIEKNGQLIGDMLGLTDGLNVSDATNKAFAVSARLNNTQREAELSSSGESGGITFNQNNYSPKALSRLDIYRQTQNQLKSLKGLVGN